MYSITVYMPSITVYMPSMTVFYAYQMSASANIPQSRHHLQHPVTHCSAFT